MEGLKAKQRRFVEEYCVDFNATQAAIRAGYSEKTAKSIGCENLTKPDIVAAIDERLESLDLTAAQTSKLMADIAQSSMNDYFVIVQKERPKPILRPLQIQIDKKKEELLRENLFIARKGLMGDDLAKYQKALERMEDEILRLEIKLEREPEAEFEDFEMETYDAVELDLIKLTQDKERGKIKSFQWGEFGPKVEMFAADKMIVNIANKLGFFTNRMQMLDKNGEPTDPTTPDPLAPVQLNITVLSRKEEDNADIQRATAEGSVQ
ncbi:terminase small subunit [Sphingobacterium sp. LRF_L2]|uniref:terminase small subunit n=1 Tax=Sphingobacterium sp. LRF_L2 TaxID=3369421 RepID=UPI003F5E0AD3